MTINKIWVKLSIDDVKRGFNMTDYEAMRIYEIKSQISEYKNKIDYWRNKNNKKSSADYEKLSENLMVEKSLQERYLETLELKEL